MSSAATHKTVNILSPARHVPDMRSAAVNTSVAVKPIRPLYERLHRSRIFTITSSTTAVAPRQKMPTANVSTSRKRPGVSAARIPKLLARARADYDQKSEEAFKKTKIPRPTISALKQANLRQRSEFWARMPSVILRPRATIMRDLAKDLTNSTSLKDMKPEPEKMEFEDTTLNPDEPSLISETGIDDTSLMFNDASFDESVSPDHQTSILKVMGRKIVGTRRLGLGLRTNRAPWFVGLARCPRYTGENVGTPRVRLRSEVIVKEPKKGSLTTSLVLTPPKSGTTAKRLRQSVATTMTTTTKQNARSEALKTSGAKSSAAAKISKATRKIAMQPSSHEKLKPSRPIKSNNSQTLPAKPHTVSIAHRQKFIPKSKTARNRVPVSMPHHAITRKPTAKRSVSTKTYQRPEQKGVYTSKPVLRSAVHTPNTAVAKKKVEFVQGPIKPHFYSGNDTAKLSALPPPSLLRSQSFSAGPELFEGTGNGSLKLKNRFLHRYASVQAYEACRREEALAKGEQPGVGQLDYGNADIKVTLQASKVIEAHHIGTLQNLNALGKLGALKGDSKQATICVWVFGSFKEPYHPRAIPTKRVTAYKKPLCWPVTGSEEGLEAFVNEHFKCLQTADVSI